MGDLAHVYFSPLSVDRSTDLSVDRRSTVDRLSIDSRPTVGRPIGQLSTATSTDRGLKYTWSGYLWAPPHFSFNLKFPYWFQWAHVCSLTLSKMDSLKTENGELRAPTWATKRSTSTEVNTFTFHFFSLPNLHCPRKIQQSTIFSKFKFCEAIKLSFLAQRWNDFKIECSARIEGERLPLPPVSSAAWLSGYCVCAARSHAARAGSGCDSVFSHPARNKARWQGNQQMPR